MIIRQVFPEVVISLIEGDGIGPGDSAGGCIPWHEVSSRAHASSQHDRGHQGRYGKGGTGEDHAEGLSTAGRSAAGGREGTDDGVDHSQN